MGAAAFRTVRFLKQGLVNIEMPSNLSVEEEVRFAKDYLDTLSDQDLVLAMSDCVPSGPNPTRFDADSFQVEALEDTSNDYKVVYSTDLWKEYINE